MSKYSLNVAQQYGENLESFNSLDEAEQYFLSYRNSLLNRLENICKNNFSFMPDYTADSLKQLEKWYFDLFENNSFDDIGLNQEEFEEIMSIYFGEVAVRNNDNAKWIVEEFAFVKDKYVLLVNKGAMNMAIDNKCKNWFKKPDNKRHTLLFREYNKYFS